MTVTLLIRLFGIKLLNNTPLVAITILLILPLFSMNVFGEASIELKSYNTSIDPRGNVLVIGKISGATPYIPVKLTISDPSGKMIYTPNVEFDGDGNFKYLIKPTLPQFSIGTYTIEATHRDLPQPVQLNFEVSSGGQEDAAIIPEFGPIVIVILVMSITAIIIITGRYKVLGFQKI